MDWIFCSSKRLSPTRHIEEGVLVSLVRVLSELLCNSQSLNQEIISFISWRGGSTTHNWKRSRNLRCSTSRRIGDRVGLVGLFDGLRGLRRCVYIVAEKPRWTGNLDRLAVEH